MEEAAKVIGGVAGELIFFLRAFWLGFMLRFLYEPLILLRKIFSFKKPLLDVQDILFWIAAGCMMFGMMFRENNGTPRLFAIAGILAGMAMYHNGPGRFTKEIFKRLQKMLNKRRKTTKKRLKKEKKSIMIKKQDGRSRNKRGDNNGRKNGSQKESESKMDYAGVSNCADTGSDDVGCRK